MSYCRDLVAKYETCTTGPSMHRKIGAHRTCRNARTNKHKRIANGKSRCVQRIVSECRTTSTRDGFVVKYDFGCIKVESWDCSIQKHRPSGSIFQTFPQIPAPMQIKWRSRPHGTDL